MNDIRILLIILACVVVLLIGVLKKKVEWLLNIMMRCIIGTLAIYFVNKGMENFGIVLGVGINEITILTSGILGVPGLLALYGIGIYRRFVAF